MKIRKERDDCCEFEGISRKMARAAGVLDLTT
jgi:hypothetical protein